MRQARYKVAHMIQKIIKKSSKINAKSMEIEAWIDPRSYWGRLGNPIGDALGAIWAPKQSGTKNYRCEFPNLPL